MTAHCRYCCRSCGSHFASLEAFDAHRSGPYDNRVCSFPEDAGLVEIPNGVCKISDPTAPLAGVTIYSTERAARAQEAFRAREGRQAARAKRKRGAKA